MLRIAVCDDDSHFLNILVSESLNTAAKKSGESLKVKRFTDGMALLSDFQQGFFFDIVILDIEMPSINGKTLAQMLRQIDRSFSLVFLTAYEQEVFDTLKYQVSAFIPKKSDSTNCISELSRVISEHAKKVASYQLLEIYKAGEPVSVKLSIDNIVGFHFMKQQIFVKTLIGEWILQETIFRNILNAYRPKGFIECSRNYLVNVKRISEVKTDSIVLENGDIYPLSRRRAKDVLKSFNTSILEEVVQ